MGTYGLSSEEIIETFDKWLKETSSGEGDISAQSIAGAWNKIAERMGWDDRLDVRHLK